MTRAAPKTPHVLLLENHQHIDLLLDRLRAAVHADDREATAKRWAEAEKVILKHLDVEEALVFPALRPEHEGEIAALRREHGSIRSGLAELGLALEIHTLRSEAIESFCATLRAHAAREDALAYVAADRALPAPSVRAIAARIRDAMRGVRTTGGGAAATAGRS
jgi:hypothetical protein